MKLRNVLALGVVLLVLAQSGCDAPTEPETKTSGGTTTNLRGTVIRNDNLSTVAGAIVLDLSGLARDTSKSDGTFLLKYTLSSRYVGKVIASRSGFGNDTANVILDPGHDTTITLRVRADSSSPIVGTTKPSLAANIVLKGITDQNVAVRGSGLNETSILTFEVRDSSGTPVGPNNKVTVNFTIQGGPGGGEYVFPVSQETDPITGTATTRVTSGTKAGIIQVYAATTVAGLTLRSSPVRLTVSGGLPVQERLTIAREKTNIAGGVIAGLHNKISVIVGDRDGNPVIPNTAVYFTTTGGIIQPSGQTDQNGGAAVDLITGNPQPSGGIASITARTVGDSGKVVTRSIPVVFSGATRIIGPTTAFSIPDSGTYAFTYNVQDANGNPLTAGTTISVTTSGFGAADLQLSGDVNANLPDTDDPSFTRFAVIVADTKKGGASGPVTIKITVTSQNGNATYSFAGEVKGQQIINPPPTPVYQAASIVFVGATDQNIAIRGSGLNETSFLTFEVRDSLGLPVQAANKITVNFSILGGPGGGEYVFPVSQQTDTVTGKVTTRVTSGTKAGIIQVYATARVGTKTITSSPVRLTVSGGLPAQERFTISREKANLAGGVLAGLQSRISVLVGDKEGNPVIANTAVYFTTTGGIIQPSTQTDQNGGASVNLITGNPQPPGGIATITARTVGDSGRIVSRSIPVVFSGPTRIIGPASGFSIQDGGTYAFTYNVQDANGNPLSAGTSITVSASGPGSADLLLTGDVAANVPDTDDPAFTSFAVTVTDTKTGGVSGPVTIKISVASQNGNATYSISGDVQAQQGIVQPPASARQPAQIAFVSVTASDIFVSGTGALENSVLTYEVRDSLGTPIDKAHRAYATYSLQFFPNSYAPGGTQPRLIPSADSTDDTGKLRLSVNSGTTAGVVQAVVTINSAFGAIKSQPVRISINSGFPDQKHFSVYSTNYNFPGLERPGQRSTVTVQIADKYSNPVQSGTAVLFSTHHGSVQTIGGLTGADGFVTKELISGNPTPEGVDVDPVLGSGYSYVAARTIGESGVQVSDSILVLWTGKPIITKTDTNNNFNIANGGSAGPFRFTVVDKYGHPMSGGTTISVSGPGLILSGNGVSATINDTFATGPGVTSFTVVAQDADASALAVPPLVSILTLTVVHPVYGTYTLVLATGTVQ
jgi:hypothetical protein